MSYWTRKLIYRPASFNFYTVFRSVHKEKNNFNFQYHKERKCTSFSFIYRISENNRSPANLCFQSPEI